MTTSRTIAKLRPILLPIDHCMTLNLVHNNSLVGKKFLYVENHDRIPRNSFDVIGANSCQGGKRRLQIGNRDRLHPDNGIRKNADFHWAGSKDQDAIEIR